MCIYLVTNNPEMKIVNRYLMGATRILVIVNTELQWGRGGLARVLRKRTTVLGVRHLQTTPGEFGVRICGGDKSNDQRGTLGKLITLITG